MKQLLISLTLPLVLAACDMTPPYDVADPAPDQCGAGGMQYLVGQPSSVLAAMTFPEGTRIAEPGSVMTMDYRSDRLNILIGEDGNIDSVHCG